MNASDHSPQSFASKQDGSYPRPQLVRSAYCSLDRLVGFAYDDDDRGRAEHWERIETPFDRSIQLPFAPESDASGVGVRDIHPIVWYRIEFGAADLVEAEFGDERGTLMLRFGAVDYTADVWVDGVFVGRHRGGHTAFSFDVTAALADSVTHVITVRAEDDPSDTAKPRGKQDWLERPHSIWYERTTGIWRSVWLEAVPRTRIARLDWIADSRSDSAIAAIELEGGEFRASRRVKVELFFEGEPIGLTEVAVTGQRATIDVPIESRRNGQDRQNNHWSPAAPRLVDATVTLADDDGQPIDVVRSYFGIRTVEISAGRFILNNRVVFVRSVLEQGYWPTSHLTAPSAEALRAEVELILSLGFNAARVHQKTEDPRFLYWADRLGLMLWGEIASAYEFDPLAIERTTDEWIATVRDYRSHPSIVTWVPLNESWGVQSIGWSAAQQAFSSGLARLTRAIDPTRPVVSNDGWEHTDSDIWTIHDYEEFGDAFRERYGSADGVQRMLDGRGPAGRVMRAAGSPATEDSAVMVTEFGGVSFDVGGPEDHWGYSTARDAGDFRGRVGALFAAACASPVLAGFCYTQLTDTLQETNGLCDANREPKLPAAEISRMVRGD